MSDLNTFLGRAGKCAGGVSPDQMDNIRSSASVTEQLIQVVKLLAAPGDFGPVLIALSNVYNAEAIKDHAYTLQLTVHEAMSLVNPVKAEA